MCEDPCDPTNVGYAFTQRVSTCGWQGEATPREAPNTGSGKAVPRVPPVAKPSSGLRRYNCSPYCRLRRGTRGTRGEASIRSFAWGGFALPPAASIRLATCPREAGHHEWTRGKASIRLCWRFYRRNYVAAKGRRLRRLPCWHI